MLAAGIVIVPDDWKLEEKIGLPLAAIHYPVSVLNSNGDSLQSVVGDNDNHEHDHNHRRPRSILLRAMENFFDKMHSASNVNDVHMRFNWTFQSHPFMSNRLPTSSSIFEKVLDAVDLIGFRHQHRFLFRKCINWFRTSIMGIPLLALYLRTERQVLRIIPSNCRNNNGISFLIRTQVNPLEVAVAGSVFPTSPKGDGSSENDKVGIKDVLVEKLKAIDATKDNSGKARYKEEVLAFLATTTTT